MSNIILSTNSRNMCLVICVNWVCSALGKKVNSWGKNRAEMVVTFALLCRTPKCSDRYFIELPQ